MESATPTPSFAGRDLEHGLAQEALALRQVEAELRKVLVGQQYLVDRMLVGMLCRGHLLIEGVPGLAKTLAVKTLARTLSIRFQRIQFTPDLLPADLVGTLIYDQRTGEFVPRKGPIFTQLLLADEINRAPAKVQSALLEAMEERQVTLGESTWRLAEPFMVLATQNPIEQEGTYPLAEAQIDRFLMKLVIGYPSREEERAIFDRHLVESPGDVRPVLDPERIGALQRAADAVYLDPKIREYVLDVVQATRQPQAAGLRGLAELIAFGASPRATLFLARAAKAMALLHGRAYVVPEDVKEVAPDVLRHRIVPTYEAEAEEVTADQLVARVLEQVEVP
ncbi:MAG TPA: MoxR family ATPase [Thermoanaerobaculia bacterium]|jgi:MoxR-like ATPase|nr:MoxR family ATPase [Thermoanaerobaculia bacterium]